MYPFNPWPNPSGYYLADRGYDVWLANFRGGKHSISHLTLLADDDNDYWDFSFHEMGYYDYPAIIDYVLAKTNRPQLQLIAYSQGTTAFFVMCSERPEYNAKVQSMHGLAPVVFEKEFRSPWLQMYAPLSDMLKVTERWSKFFVVVNTNLIRTVFSTF